jgi:hypothetical protein
MTATLTNGLTFHRVKWHPGTYAVRLWGLRIGRVEKVQRASKRGGLVWRWEATAPGPARAGDFDTRTEAANALAEVAKP